MPGKRFRAYTKDISSLSAFEVADYCRSEIRSRRGAGEAVDAGVHFYILRFPFRIVFSIFFLSLFSVIDVSMFRKYIAAAINFKFLFEGIGHTTLSNLTE